jgi:hypothetical protein
MWSTQVNDVVDSEMDRLAIETGHAIGAPSPVQYGVDLRGVRTVDGQDAYARYQELAGHPTGRQSLKDAVHKIMLSPATRSRTTRRMTMRTLTAASRSSTRRWTPIDAMRLAS